MKKGRTKTPAGTRPVELPAGIAVLYEELLDSRRHPLVLCTPEGRPWRRSNFRQNGTGARPGTELTPTSPTPRVTCTAKGADLPKSAKATDSETGETGPRPVAATITTQGTKDLVELTIDTDGSAGETTATLTATATTPSGSMTKDGGYLREICRQRQTFAH
ncbi:hypothetical protein [Actinophytocola xanthii]|uniref:hypothetical protein n=1 Tax=Actinophytocola xanthii TaxID=1912961 RepID=UPI000A9DD539